MAVQVILDRILCVANWVSRAFYRDKRRMASGPDRAHSNTSGTIYKVGILNLFLEVITKENTYNSYKLLKNWLLSRRLTECA